MKSIKVFNTTINLYYTKVGRSVELFDITLTRKRTKVMLTFSITKRSSCRLNFYLKDLDDI